MATAQMDIYQLDDPQLLATYLAQSMQVHSLADPLLDDKQSRPPISSAKDFFFQEKENLFVFDGECFRETLPTPSPVALFGVHSCDLTAIAYQDQFFADDPYYQARRQQALLVGIDCNTPCDYGFCYAVNAGPGVDLEYADIILHRLNHQQWLLVVSSEKGRLAISGFDVTPADSAALRQREQHIDHCEQQFGDFSELHRAIEAINNEQLADSFWEPMGLQCLSCSGCTTLCPTCSCYGTRDVHNNDGQITEQRFWDSCLFEGFQREASQHNPSLTAGSRVRRFWTHKFNQHTADQFNRYGCVGCGRCEQTCPGVIGVHSVMKRAALHANTDAN